MAYLKEGTMCLGRLISFLLGGEGNLVMANECWSKLEQANIPTNNYDGLGQEGWPR